MKNLILFASSALLLLLLFSCKEKPIKIPELQLGDRKVLVEELTGVTCQNCPAGTTELLDLESTLGDQLIIVALHTAAGYDVPFGNSKYDFRTPDGDAVGDYLYVNGDPGAPAAAIDRQFLPNETELFLYRPWKGLINTRVAAAPNIGLFLEKTYNPDTRELSLKVNVSPDEPLTNKIRLSVYITEDSIVDLQQKGAQIIPNYLHRHVFRDAVSAPTGDDISTEIGTGEAFSKSYAVTLPPNWVAEHCSIVAFIHRHGGTLERQVLQAEEIHLR